ncbi:MAG: helix-turn-helix domain-containing protein [Gammaproteobacteria bacterium]|nr:helix-turn-helix domain-containing protein [Gammaproteobacteria bacterium]
MNQIARTVGQVGVAVRRRRRALGLSQSRLGSMAGLRQATISALENGSLGTRLNTLIDVMVALELEAVIQERSKAPKSIEELF